MKVLHVIDSLVTGGAEKLIVDSLPLFNSKGIESDIALLSGIEYPFFDTLKKQNCCKIYKLSLGSLYNPILIFKLIPLIRKYDIIHVHLFPAQYWVVFAKILSFSNCQLIFTEHSTNNRRIDNSIFKLLDIFVYKFYKKIICISVDVKSVLMEKLNISVSKLEVINNGINIAAIKSSDGYERDSFGFSNDDILIIMIAAFRKEKNHSDLIHAISKLDKRYKLILVGDGQEKSRMEELVSQLNIVNRVFFAGISTEVPKFIKMCDVGVLSSHWEGFGLSAVETLASGLPIIVSNVKGISSVLGDAAIYFVNGNVDDLIDKILLLENYSIYSKQKNKGFVKAEQYDINKSVEATIELYKKLIK